MPRAEETNKKKGTFHGVQNLYPQGFFIAVCDLLRGAGHRRDRIRNWRHDTGAQIADGPAGLGGKEEISHMAEAIHQEVLFRASRKRVYEALTQTKQFDRVIKLSQAGMAGGTKPTKISRKVGGAFTLFGGYIVGRHIELVSNARLVQAWREISWNPGVYSIVKFELTELGPETKLVFDHTGFPEGAAQHLAIGWKANYWEPLTKHLEQP